MLILVLTYTILYLCNNSDAWRAWILSSGALYSTVLVAFVRKARNLPLAADAPEGHVPR
jgi:hypothetical protein